MTIMGLPFATWCLQVGFRVGILIVGLVVMLKKIYEGKKFEEEYKDVAKALKEKHGIDVDNWYRTF